MTLYGVLAPLREEQLDELAAIVSFAVVDAQRQVHKTTDTEAHRLMAHRCGVLCSLRDIVVDAQRDMLRANADGD